MHHVVSNAIRKDPAETVSELKTVLLSMQKTAESLPNAKKTEIGAFHKTLSQFEEAMLIHASAAEACLQALTYQTTTCSTSKRKAQMQIRYKKQRWQAAFVAGKDEPHHAARIQQLLMFRIALSAGGPSYRGCRSIQL